MKLDKRKSPLNERGFFISLEGGEGSGKSTLLIQLANYLTDQGYEVIQTREPGGTALGETIRKLLLDKKTNFNIGAKAELLLFLVARAQHIDEIIRPALESNQIILCDRFNDSTVAYQSAARGIEKSHVQHLCKLVCGEVIPHLTLFLDVDPQEGLLRTKKLAKEHAESGQFDRIESEQLDFHRKVQKGFQEIAQEEMTRVYRIDANRSQQDVYREAVRVVDACLVAKR